MTPSFIAGVVARTLAAYWDGLAESDTKVVQPKLIEYFNDIKNSAPDRLETFDLAAFESYLKDKLHQFVNDPNNKYSQITAYEFFLNTYLDYPADENKIQPSPKKSPICSPNKKPLQQSTQNNVSQLATNLQPTHETALSMPPRLRSHAHEISNFTQVQKDTSVNALSSSGHALLHTAVEQGNVALVYNLLQRSDVNVNVKTLNGHYTPLHIAVLVQKDLINSRNFDPVTRKIYIQIMTMLLEHPCISTGERTSQYGLTALHLAAYANVGNALITLSNSQKVKLDERTFPTNLTALDIAVNNNDIKSVEILTNKYKNRGIPLNGTLQGPTFGCFHRYDMMGNGGPPPHFSYVAKFYSPSNK